MGNNQTSARDMLEHAKDALAESHDRNALTVALLDISAALDQWVDPGTPRRRPLPPRPRSRHYDIYNYREMPEYKAARQQRPAPLPPVPTLEDKLSQLCRQGILSIEEARHIKKMREERNAGAHGRQPDVTYEDINWYGVLVEDIVTGSRKPANKARNVAQHKTEKSTTKTHQPVRPRPVQPLSMQQKPVVPSPTVQHLPVPLPRPVLSQPAQPSLTVSNDDFLAQLLEIERGGDK